MAASAAADEPDGALTPILRFSDAANPAPRTTDFGPAVRPANPFEEPQTDRFGGPAGRVHLPLDRPDAAERVEVIARDGFFSLTAREAPLSEVLNVLADGQGVNLVLGDAVDAQVTVTLADVTFDEALNAILSASGFQWTRRRRVVIVTRIGDARATPDAQGRELRVFRLNYVATIDVGKAVTGLLSPAGQVVAVATDPKDTRRTNETLMVDDVPEGLARVQGYLAQIDAPPLQVEIGAHVLQVDLSDDLKCRVNFSRLARIGGLGLSLGTQGLVEPAGGPPPSPFFVNVDGAKTDALINAIRATTDSKVLASPRLTVLNGQQSRIQIGAQLGYLVTTTTQTSTLQNVNFLDVGVVLSVTPHISDDGQVLVFVRPEVSSGRINPQTSLPEEETTEVELAVMLPDGRGMVIGGLIKETDIDSQGKVPMLGDL